MNIKKRNDKIVIFHPFVTDAQREAVSETLKTRWIGQGPKVDEFEQKFGMKFNAPYAISVNSGSAALETAYDLIGLKEGDKVITTPLTCTATNLPLIRRGCEIIWADISPDTLNLDPDDVARKLMVNKDVKAVINVHLGGIESDINCANVPVVDDAAQALGILRRGADYSCFSFQAIKHITTGDGGMIVVKKNEDYHKAKLLRWFGIDRDKKKANDWNAFREREMIFDIEIPGQKRHMNDISASMGIAGLQAYDDVIAQRKDIFDVYRSIKAPGFKLIDSPRHTYWLATALVERREDFVKKLYEYNIETNIVQARNDIYRVFGGKRQDLPVMNAIEDHYLSIPLHNKMTVADAEYIKNVIESGW